MLAYCGCGENRLRVTRKLGSGAAEEALREGGEGGGIIAIIEVVAEGGGLW